MAKRKLTEEELKEALAQLPGWEVKDGKLHKTFKFQSFAQAIGWMVSVAVYADKLDHHPDWCNVYRKVEVDLITHDLGALSTYDLELAARMETLAG
ncbi:MAG: 4a-hydroxytetrahydrobiopterin dehydratase [Chloroflexi bacterium]|nr:4a-hydroxytetrahydrobiopterin dehydratase [Chloroflexota bacterium]MCI0577787.1 4a-hydroxytetrahydrobiopterin dehydratase [Chloroflexota bacterium]MCI0643407.1 4a-hydroxytetrahydrobiopterin dehydratase [Chloroflexota bacterium]MCI0731047.1 4a-hydroxytetrahydrobiopterin dehydratase [Chloroflexota bacterium]